MNITELKMEKVKLEDQLSAYVFGLVESFKNRTGATPTSIHIEIIRIEACGTPPEHVVGKTTVIIEI